MRQMAGTTTATYSWCGRHAYIIAVLISNIHLAGAVTHFLPPVTLAVTCVARTDSLPPEDGGFSHLKTADSAT